SGSPSGINNLALDFYPHQEAHGCAGTLALFSSMQSILTSRRRSVQLSGFWFTEWTQTAGCRGKNHPGTPDTAPFAGRRFATTNRYFLAGNRSAISSSVSVS